MPPDTKPLSTGWSGDPRRRLHFDGAAIPSSDDFAHGGEHFRWHREFVRATRAEVAARCRSDALDPRPYIDEAWIERLEAGVGILDVSYAEWMTLERSLQPVRPAWWEEGYEHDLAFAWSGHREPEEVTYKQYWARVKTVAEECDRPYRAERDPQQELRVLCELLNVYGVRYVLIESAAAIGHGMTLVTDDVDLVPAPDAANVEQLCDALNVLGPRWWSMTDPDGKRVDGRRLEPRHFRTDSAAVGLVTRLGRIDVVLQPRGFEAGYEALAPNAVARLSEGIQLHLASLDDVIRSKGAARSPQGPRATPRPLPPPRPTRPRRIAVAARSRISQSDMGPADDLLASGV